MAFSACGFDWGKLEPTSLGPIPDGGVAGGGTGGGAGGEAGSTGSGGGATGGAGGIAGSAGSPTGGAGGIAGSAGSPTGGAGGAAGSGGVGTGGLGTGGLGTGGVGTGGVGTGGVAGSGGSGGGTVVYTATVAECVNPADPDPDVCETMTGSGLMSVDGLENQTGEPNYAFVRFALDSTFAGATVTAVTLRLRAGPTGASASNQSGEVWSVASFTRASLFSSVPAQQGGAPLAGGNGSVAPNQDVEWNLPTASVSPATPLYLGIFPVTNDGVEYHNTSGAVPPTLIVEYQ